MRRLVGVNREASCGVAYPNLRDAFFQPIREWVEINRMATGKGEYPLPQCLLACVVLTGVAGEIIGLDARPRGLIDAVDDLKIERVEYPWPSERAHLAATSARPFAPNDFRLLQQMRTG